MQIKRIPIKPSEQKTLLSDLYYSILNRRKPNDIRLLEISTKLSDVKESH